MVLTAEQAQRAEANRLAAIARRKEREAAERRENKAVVSGSHESSLQHIDPVIPSTSSFCVPSVNSNSTNVGSCTGTYDIASCNGTASKTPIIRSNVCSSPSNPQPQSAAKAKCVLISRERFEMDVPYNADVIAKFKEIPSRIYDAKSRKWNFALRDYQLLVKSLSLLRQKRVISLEELPSWIRTIFFGAFSNPSTLPELTIPEFDLSPIDAKLRDALLPFQEEGIRFIISKHGRALLADDMGLGKTIQALGAAAYYKEDWPLLVICPASVRYNWLEAILRWLPSIAPCNVFVVNSAKETCDVEHCSSSTMVAIVSYDLLVLQGNVFANKFGVVIADESHFIKCCKTKRYKAAAPILKDAKRAICLTGTPALSRPEELYSQLSCVCQNVFKNFYEFGNRYCNPKPNKFGVNYSGASNTEELRLCLEEVIMLRRLKQNVLTQLPSKTRDMIVLDKASVKTNLKALRDAAAEMEREDLKGLEKRGAMLKFYSESAIAKIEAVREYIVNVIEGGQDKMLVFAHHQIVLDELSSVLAQMRVGFVRIDGSTSAEMRKRYCDDFQFQDDVKVALLSITAANMGITLTAANLVIFAELFWNPGILVQAEDRVHRVGQEQAVQIQYLVARGTSDDYMWPLVQRKLSVLHQVGLSEDKFNDAETVVLGGPNVASEPRKGKGGDRSLLEFFESLASDEDLAAANAGDFGVSASTAPANELACAAQGAKRFKAY